MIKKKVSVTGSTSSIGKLLVEKLLKNNFKLRLSTRKKKLKNKNLSKTYFGDFKKKDFSKFFLIDSDYVVNLAYSEDYNENLKIIDNLIFAANSSSKIKKFIHCSTAVVVGKSSLNKEIINEYINCKPQNRYQVNKLGIEKKLSKGLRKNIDLVILRPTEIANHYNPKSTIYKFREKFDNGLINSIYRKILGNRSINFISVENVVDSIIFFLKRKKKIKKNKNIFIISEDNKGKNFNFYSKIFENKKKKEFVLFDKLLKKII